MREGEREEEGEKAGEGQKRRREKNLKQAPHPAGRPTQSDA